MISIPVPDPQCCQAAPSQSSRETPEQELGVLCADAPVLHTHVHCSTLLLWHWDCLGDTLCLTVCSSALSRSLSAVFLGTACSWESEMAPTGQPRLTLLWALTT